MICLYIINIAKYTCQLTTHKVTCDMTYTTMSLTSVLHVTTHIELNKHR